MLDVATFKIHFDKELSRFLALKNAEVRTYTKSKAIRRIIAHSAAIAQVDGKRVRPYLGYLGYRMAGGVKTKDILRRLVGIELFHLFALIQDDIIDNATHRHGILTVHAFTQERIEKHKHAARTASSQALLAGDLAFVWSQEALLADSASDVYAQVANEFYTMNKGVIIGQMLDVNISHKDTCTVAQIEEKNLLKTARYTFVHPLKIGGRLAGTAHTARLDTFFDRIGTLLGTAYQIHDDMLDIIGSPAKIGKPILGDVAEGQHTYFTHHVFLHGSANDKKKLKNFFGKSLSKKEKEIVQAIFKSSGAINFGRRIAEKKLVQAQAHIQQAVIDTEHKEALFTLVSLLRFRSQ